MGQPGTLKACHLVINDEKRTRRTETSKYPEEKKSTEIPRVVASEMGLAEIIRILEIPGKVYHRG